MIKSEWKGFRVSLSNTRNCKVQSFVTYQYYKVKDESTLVNYLNALKNLWWTIKIPVREEMMANKASNQTAICKRVAMDRYFVWTWVWIVYAWVDKYASKAKKIVTWLIELTFHKLVFFWHYFQAIPWRFCVFVTFLFSRENMQSPVSLFPLA